MVICKTSCGFTFMIDDQDLSLVSQFTWHRLTPSDYIWTKRHGKTILLHRILFEPSAGTQIDHIDGNPANNTRANLRYCDYAQNQWNRQRGVYGSSKYKGVHWVKRDNKWQSIIKCHGKKYYLGAYLIEEDAAKAYNDRAIQLFGEYAKINQIQISGGGLA